MDMNKEKAATNEQIAELKREYGGAHERSSGWYTSHVLSLIACIEEEQLQSKELKEKVDRMREKATSTPSFKEQQATIKALEGAVLATAALVEQKSERITELEAEISCKIGEIVGLEKELYELGMDQ